MTRFFAPQKALQTDEAMLIILSQQCGMTKQAR